MTCRPWLAGALLAVLLATGSAQAALRIEDPQRLDAGTRATTQDLLDEAIARLPPVLRQAPPVAVRWTDRLPADVAGRATRGTLLLNRRFLAEGARERLVATLLHELAHYHDRRTGLSRDPRLLDLAGWQERARKPGRERANPFTDRSPDRYELDAPAEFLAVNLEHFLLDPQYACRRPALYRFLAGHFGWAPAAAECAPGLAWLDASAGPGEPSLAVLDPARVQAVEYLLAEGNDELMSRWGHSMLRLVVCAPGREPGPDCHLDLQHHLVLSFRAFVDDVQLSSWAGLTGGYPSRLFVLPLDQVVEEYTAVQLRDLRSIPLDLQPAEIAMLLERVGRLHWSYDGRYRFIGNNCAVETFKLLHDGVPRLAGERLAAITPTGLLSKLEKRGIADASVLEDEERALRLGYRFESLEPRFQQMLDIARMESETCTTTPSPACGRGPARGLRPLPVHTPAAWFGLAAQARHPWFTQATPRATAAFLLLEHAARRRHLAQARDWLKRRYLDGADGGTGLFEAAEAALAQLLEGAGFATRPAMLLDGEPGYGLPQAAERRAIEETAVQRRAQMKRLQEQLEAQATSLLDPALVAELEAIDANIAALGERLRDQQQEGGDFVLPQGP